MISFIAGSRGLDLYNGMEMPRLDFGTRTAECVVASFSVILRDAAEALSVSITESSANQTLCHRLVLYLKRKCDVV